MADVKTVENDPITLEIYWNRLIAIADQAAAALVRTSFSTILRESNDYACVLMDTNGEALAENRGSIPAFVGCLPRTMKHFLRSFPLETWQPGDVVITNDPWMGTGHRPDIVMAAPVYHRGRLVAFTGSIAHMSDIGGAIFSADCRSVFEEGIGIPPVKVLSQGKTNDLLLEFIQYNVRVPEQVMGDLFAMVTSAEVSGQRLAEFMEEYDLRDLDALSRVIQGRAEAAMRDAIAQAPDGVYRGQVWLDGYDHPLKIQATITVAGDELTVDFAGTSEQVSQGGINCVYNYTWAYTTYPLKCLLDPFTHKNEGSYRPLHIVAPEGSLLNATYPAPVDARNLVGHCIAAAILEALAAALPGRVIADSGSSPSFTTVFTGTGHSGYPFTYILFANGGMGARPNQDGLACTSFPSNVTTGSIEVMESLAPLLVWKKEVRQDSGGPGRFRGGYGQEIVIEVAGSHPLAMSVMTERADFPPQGLLGGEQGTPTRVQMEKGEQVLPRKGRTQLLPGDIIKLSFAGGGGFGPPGERDPALVREDLRNGIISPEAARSAYHLKEVERQGDTRR